MYGIQTVPGDNQIYVLFENDVNMYGIQTHIMRQKLNRCLRMM